MGDGGAGLTDVEIDLATQLIPAFPYTLPH